jgi:hypothetical protein
VRPPRPPSSDVRCPVPARRAAGTAGNVVKLLGMGFRGQQAEGKRQEAWPLRIGWRRRLLTSDL